MPQVDFWIPGRVFCSCWQWQPGTPWMYHQLDCNCDCHYGPDE